MQYNFEWDPVKAKHNAEKHGVTFERATEVFKDPMALTLYDEEHAYSEEDRWITLGQANGHHYLVVVHTFRSQQDDTMTIRLISARPATKQEIKQYEG
jgi:uncharacterized protein